MREARGGGPQRINVLTACGSCRSSHALRLGAAWHTVLQPAGAGSEGRVSEGHGRFEHIGRIRRCSRHRLWTPSGRCHRRRPSRGEVESSEGSGRLSLSWCKTPEWTNLHGQDTSSMPARGMVRRTVGIENGCPLTLASTASESPHDGGRLLKRHRQTFVIEPGSLRAGARIRAQQQHGSPAAATSPSPSTAILIPLAAMPRADWTQGVCNRNARVRLHRLYRQRRRMAKQVGGKC